MKRFHKLWDRVLKVAAVGATVCVIVVGFVFALHRAGKLQQLEWWAYDSMIRLHLQRPELSTADDIVIVGIDDFDLKLLHHYPLYDEDKIKLLDRLEAASVRSVGLDLYLDIPIGNDAAATKKLQMLLGRERNIVCGYFVGRGDSISPEVLPPLGPSGVKPLMGRRIGFTDQRPDTDGVSRTGLLLMTDAAASGDESAVASQSLSVGVANQFLESAGTLKRPDPSVPADLKDPAHLLGFWEKALHRFRGGDGGYVNADASGFQYLIDYRGPAKFPIYQLRQVIPFDAAELATLPGYARRPFLKASAFTGKVVLVGMTSPSVKDYIATPLHRDYDEYGVEQHALLVDQLIRTARAGYHPLHTWTATSLRLWMIGWAILGTLAGLSARIGYSPNAPWRLLLVGILGEVVLILITGFAFSRGNWIPFVPPSLCWFMTTAIVGTYISQLERTDRNVLNNLFARICQAEIATELWKRRDEILDDGKLRAKRLGATLMFTDLRGFSTECEKLDPYAIINWLNRYHEIMTAVVTQYQGVAVRYMGDGMMAVFGAPRTSLSEQCRREDARNAVNCGLEMRSKMVQLHEEWRAAHLPCLPMRIGIQSGLVVEGSLGSASRLEYVTLGDTTNVASRLENWRKELMDEDITAGVCRILIGQETNELVSNQFEVRKFPGVKLDGRETLLDVFGVTVENHPGPPCFCDSE